jgi:hypothetical protein
MMMSWVIDIPAVGNHYVTNQQLNRVTMFCCANAKLWYRGTIKAASSSCSRVLCIAAPWREKAVILHRQRCAAMPQRRVCLSIGWHT